MFTKCYQPFSENLLVLISPKSFHKHVEGIVPKCIIISLSACHCEVIEKGKLYAVYVLELASSVTYLFLFIAYVHV